MSIPITIMLVDTISQSVTLVSLVAFFIFYLLYLTVYRLILSPIAHFPGPKLAALTYWYEFWYDVIAEPEYTFKIGRLHKRYGPIIRINPDEIHIADPDFYDTIYAGSGRKRDKWDWITRSFGVDESLIGTLGHDEHRVRRAALSPYFSKQSVRALQPLIDRNMGILLGRFHEFALSGATMRLDDAFAALANDIVEYYAFGRSENRLQAPDFDPSFRDAMLQGGKSGHVLKHFPWLMDMLRKLPDSLLLKLSPAMGAYSQLQGNIKRQVAEIQHAHQTHAYEKTQRTIFHEILNSKLSDYDKSNDRLWQEGEVVVAAGTITTAWALGVSTYFALATPAILSQLKAELETAIPDPSQPLSLAALERLPFLTGVVQEGVRLSHAISHRLHRICPDETLVYRSGGVEWRIPPGTPLSMTSNLVHHDERVFSDSHVFKPERWVDNPRLDHYLVSFGKGGRACLGINLAYAELYLTLASLFRVYGTVEVRGKDDVGMLELFETSATDLVITSDTAVPVMPEDSKGLRVKVHRLVE
ncbi:cytochrome P450 [Xylaria bambusicola]|uniref:cytochrome P450 n=1 Tax=Xylaria bambusicola TaxID=326684 RepID=UPI002007E409|nr:cytochrome P450 [Xylaria bambusicola]KAI0521301.1 cytochrome P450 [Xylaria bambusicola]